MKRKTSTKTEKLNETREKRLKEHLRPREEKQNQWEKTYKYVERRFIDLSYVCQQLADGCKVCKTEISLTHYEDDTVTGLANMLDMTYLHHNFFLYCMIRYMLFRSERLL